MIVVGRKSVQVGPRLPPSIYDWLMKKVDSEEYPNVTQAVVGVLTKCRADEEKAEICGEMTTNLGRIERRLEILESENTALKEDLTALKAWQSRMDEISRVVAEYQDTI